MPNMQIWKKRLQNIFLLIKNISLGTGSDAVLKTNANNFKRFRSFSISPCFPMYFIYGATFNSKFKSVGYDNFNQNGFDAFYELINEKTSLVIFTNPGSPFGYFYKSKEVDKFAFFLKSRDIALLIDEAYVEFAPGDCLELVKKYNNLFISRTFSKAWGAAGVV